ncbi:hypothetical protein C8Q75DRAFT_471168 [Abortiporus biennis]|nr:hypothetical protein C8Q75DRAFT_471168 [Abortiporus biennis]
MKIFPNITFISLIDPRFAELTFSTNALYASPPKSPVTSVVSEGQNSSTLSCGDSGSASNPLSIDLDRTRLPLQSLLLYFQAWSYPKLNNVSTVLTTLHIFSEIEFFQVDGCLGNDLEKQKPCHNHSQPSNGLLCDAPRRRHVLFKTDNPRRTSSLPFFQMLHQSSIPCLTTISVQHFSVDECHALGEILKTCGSRLLKVCLEISLELIEKLDLFIRKR